MRIRCSSLTRLQKYKPTLHTQAIFHPTAQRFFNIYSPAGRYCIRCITHACHCIEGVSQAFPCYPAQPWGRLRHLNIVPRWIDVHCALHTIQSRAFQKTGCGRVLVNQASCEDKDNHKQANTTNYSVLIDTLSMNKPISMTNLAAMSIKPTHTPP